MKLWARCILALALLLPALFSMLNVGVLAADKLRTTTEQGVVIFKVASKDEVRAPTGGRIVAPATAEGIVIYRAPVSDCPKGSERVGEKCLRSCPSEMYRYRGKCLCPEGLVADGNRCREEEVVVTCQSPRVLRGGECVLPACPGDTFRSGGKCVCDSGLVRRGDRCKARPQIAIYPMQLPDGTQGQAYPTIQLSASRGAPPYSFSQISGTLPAGLNVTPVGRLTGTPLQSGRYSFTLRATDTDQFTGSRAYSMKIAPREWTCPKGMVKFGANCVADGSGGTPSTGGGPSTYDPPADLARPMQAELKRLGCLSGRVDGIWGSGSRAALSRFVRKTGLRLNRREPTEAALRAASSRPRGYCDNGGGGGTSGPKKCYGDTYLEGGKCVCDAGFKKRGNKCIEEGLKKCYGDTYLEGGKCVCDAGYKKRGNKCIKEDPKCYGDTYLEGGKCVCDAGYKKRGNKCIRIKTCSDGYERRNGRCQPIRPNCGRNQYVCGGKCCDNQTDTNTGGGGGNKKKIQKCKVKCGARGVRCLFKGKKQSYCNQVVARCKAQFGC